MMTIGGLTSSEQTTAIKEVCATNDVRTLVANDPPPLKWSDLRYVFDIKEDCNGKEAIQA
jgi:hypothetical protein